MSPARKNSFVYFCAVLIILTDQLTKFLVRINFAQGESLPLIKSIFHITLVFNKGAAFGMFANAGYFFIFISIAVVIGIAIFLFTPLEKIVGSNRRFFLTGLTQKSEYNIRIALMCIMAGAVSNLIDRVRFGYVVDYFDFRIWPVFNIADSAITLGTLWLAWRLIYKKNDKLQNSKHKINSNIKI